MSVVYLNGQFLEKDEARVSVDDRGFLFGDGVYEVTPAYMGRFFRFDEHLARFRRGLKALQIDFDPATLEPVHGQLLARNGLEDAPITYVYVQVTRGVAPRSHEFPDPPTSPTVYAFAKQRVRPDQDRWDQGFAAITVPDQRWARVDIKTIGLLPNVLAQQAAAEAGVLDAIQVRDGVALEGAHNNLFVVIDGVVTTAPKSNHILHGVTRDFIIQLAGELGLPVEERAVLVSELYAADEVFFCGTTTEIRPTVQVDGRQIGDGRAGPVTRRLLDGFLAAVAAASDVGVEVG